MTPAPIPLEQALKELDSPAAAADRKRRAQKWAETLEGDARGAMFSRAGAAEIDRIKEPFRTHNRLLGAELAAVEREAGRIADGIILKACESALRSQDEWAAHNDPDRAEAQKLWSEYATGVAAISWAQGNKEPAFLAKWKALIAARNEAEEFGVDAEVRTIDARLLRLVGIPYPASAEPPSTNGTRTRRQSRTNH